jgi:riboflavin biosynthesis pyrimidine reductase/RimJ/RimL family protein N-acetyltransferase
MTDGVTLDGVGRVSIRRIDGSHPRPASSSIYDDWGEFDPLAQDMDTELWIIEVADDSGTTPVGDLSAHSVWHGPTPGSRARNIGVSIADEWRGRGIGAVAQRLLAEELHALGVTRVEASTDVTNIAEQRALARAGFALEGVLRSAQQRRDGQHDLQLWSHLAEPSAPASRLTLDAIDDVDLARAYPWPLGRPWLRAMMLVTLDGAVAGADGRSGSLSSPTDRIVMAEVRRLSDAVLIGAGTLRAERYTPMRARDEAQQERAELGLATAPVLAIVSGSLDLPWGDPVFSESTHRPIVLTTPTADPDRMSEARSAADLIVLPGVDSVAVESIAALHARGLQRIVCEGGVRLLAGVAGAGLVDEVDLSVSPLLAAGGQVTVGPPLESPRRFALAQVLHHEDFLFTRFLAADPDGAAPGAA